MRLIAAALAAGLLAQPLAAKSDPLDGLSRKYVAIVLELGEREPGYVDAYYGPKAAADAAKAKPRTLAALARAAASLDRALARRPADQPRGRFLRAQVRAVRTRLRMLQGEKLPFQEEAEGLFGVRPPLKPLAAYDPLLAEIDRIVPGTGPLAERVDAFRLRYRVPEERLEAVMQAAIRECRARTVRYIALPQGEAFTLELVKNQPWSGYNWYQGGYRSRIQVNTDLPVFIDRAVDLGCHEGYPGHHALNILLEEKLTRGRGWGEFAVYPLFSPQSLIAEGSANYGIELAFPGPERLAFERDTLFPLAGLDPAAAAAFHQLGEATKALAGARLTVAELYLDGKIDRTAAIALSQKYQLISEPRARQGVDFIDKYRSYVINYATGLDMVRAKVESAGPDPRRRWGVMETLISTPATPADLMVEPARPNR